MSPGEASQELCTGCGLCCDGTFFGSVALESSERERLGRVGLRVVDRDGRPVMPQPCTALRGSLCDVYADRPDSCRRYACTLRDGVAAGTTSLDDARTSVLRMRLLLATVRAAFDLPENASIWEAIVALEEPAGDPRSAEIRRFDEGLAAAGELVELARAVFEPKLAGGGSR